MLHRSSERSLLLNIIAVHGIDSKDCVHVIGCGGKNMVKKGELWGKLLNVGDPILKIN